MAKQLQVDDFGYELPQRLIAQKPAAQRDRSRLMVVRREGGAPEHCVFTDLPRLLLPGDLLVLNDTRVIPARFFARRSTGGRLEGLFLRTAGEGLWEVLLNGRGRLRAGQQLDVMDGRDRCRATILLEEDKGDGVWHVRPTGPVDAFELLKSVGKVPLPPYIRREQAERQETTQDRRRYQTVYAKRDGAVAAPTAGLHFTRRLFERLEKAGVETSFIMLHVGLGTFQPVRATYVRDHRMHAEYYELSAETVRKIRAARKSGGRIVAVGTTTVRALESAAAKGRLEPRAEWTDIFIHPPFRFRVVDALITNFHLPRSTLLMLVSAFAGRGRILEAYEEAKRLAYRFYSYGDAMLIL